MGPESTGRTVTGRIIPMPRAPRERPARARAVGTCPRLAPLLISALLSAVAPGPSHTAAAAPATLHGDADEITAFFPEPGIFEQRGRLHLKFRWAPADWLVLKAAGTGEFLLRGGVADGHDTALRLRETGVEIRTAPADLFAGVGTVVWGVLDEIQPNDVINPLDVSRFFFEGRGGARLPVPIVRGRLYLPASLSVELAAAPLFAHGVFDELGEPESPFNVASGVLPAGIPREVAEPTDRIGESEYGARISGTVARVDFHLYGWRGRTDFPVYHLTGLDPRDFRPVLSGDYPRFTLLGADAETVAGRWGVRGEIAWFPEETFQHPAAFERVEGSRVQGGIGADREIGDWFVNGDVVYQRRRAEGEIDESEEELNLVAGIERTYRDDRARVDALVVGNPIDDTLFLRLTAGINPVRGIWIELSGGLFSGDGGDLIGRFESADFLYLRAKGWF